MQSLLNNAQLLINIHIFVHEYQNVGIIFLNTGFCFLKTKVIQLLLQMGSEKCKLLLFQSYLFFPEILSLLFKNSECTLVEQ